MNHCFARGGAVVHDSSDVAGFGPPASRNLRLFALLTALLVAVGALVAPVAASAAAGDVGVEGPSHSGTGTPTGTKRAESALWFNDGLWWGNLWDTASSDFHIFRLNAATGSWVNTGVATETRANTHHDVLWDGTTLYVASHMFVNDGLPAEANFPTLMRRYSYNSSTKTYSLLSSTQINNYKVEVLTIDKDSTGRVWATWQQGNKIYLNATGTDGKTWGTPFQHPASLSNVSVDDTSALIAFGPGKMGLMWSRQVGDATDGMYWSYRADSASGAPNTGWSTPVAAVSGQRSADDHMNLKWLDSSGDRAFAAVKTSFTSAPQPLIQLLELSGTTWSHHTIAPVSECPNRVIVLIDESTQMLRTFATYPKPNGTTNAGVCTTSGGAIYEKSTPLNKIDFTAAKTARIVDADQYVHNVTSTKQNLNSAARGTAKSGLLVLADVNATSRYWHFYDPSSGADTTAPTVTGTSPAAGATGVAVTANATGTFSEAMDASTVTSSTFELYEGTAPVPPNATPVSAVVSYTGNVATLNPNADLKAGTTYTAVIKGGSGGVKDVAGNALAQDKTWSFTTAAAGGGDTTAPTVTGTSPADGATGVAVTANATGTFSEAMDASTVTSSTFELYEGTTPVPPNATPVSAVVSYTGNVATLNPNADLKAGTTYTAMIKGGSGGVKDVAGNALAQDKTWTFTTAAAGGGTSETVTLTATADSYVTSGATGTNYGTSTLLGVDSSPVEVTYLKFDLSAYAGRTLVSATLQLRSAGSGSTGTQNVKLVADDSWTEGGITYSSRPALGTSIGTLGPTTTNTTYNVPLTVSGLTGELGQQLSLGMDSSSSDGLDLNSKEAGSTNAPTLILTVSGGSGGGDTTAPTVTSTSPAAGANGVAVTANATGTFSEAMDASTVTSSTFTLQTGTTTVPATVTYSSTDRVATLNPGADLAAGATYTATIKGGSGGVKDVAGNALAQDKTWSFTTAAAGGGDTTAPTVTGTSPAAGATGVAVTANATGTFSEAMDASTVTSSTFELQTGTTTVPATVTYSSTDRVATLNPGADLAAGTTYTAMIKGGSGGVKDVAGNALAQDKTWTFTTAAAGGGTSETVTLTATADSYVTSGATGTNYGTSTLLGVDNSPVEVTYLKFDLSAYAGRTLVSATLQLRSAGSGSTGTQNVKLVADDSWTESGITYSNKPQLGTSIGTLGPTTTNTTYNVPLTVSGLTGELGQQLSLGMDSSSSDGLDLNSKEAGSTNAPTLILTVSGGSGGGDTTAPTVTSTSPAAGATGVAVTANATGTFSEAMDASTVTSSTFTLQTGTTTVPATVTYSSTDRVATLNPGADLAAGATYTATIKGGSGGVKDVAGNALAQDKTWSFTTAAAGGGDTTAPTVTGTSPAAGATGVAVTANATGTFSEAMDASTVTSSTFELQTGTTTVPATVTYSSTDRVATLNPGADLAAGTTYTAMIKGGSGGVKDVAGNALAQDKTWTFTTAAAGGGTSETVTLTATADSYVTSGATGTNYGTSTLLGVDNSPVEVTYLKFDLSAYAGRTLVSATLQLRSAGSGSTGTQNVKLVADDSWTEGGITYSNKPQLGTSIGTLGPTTTNTTYNVPLTVSGLTGELGQQLSLGMDSSSSDGLDLNSKEAGSTNAPTLILTLTK